MTEPPCIEWWRSSRRDRPHYGLLEYHGKLVGAHRVVMALIYGDEAIAGRDVLHLCDNKRCIRPDHLQVGTRSENMQDYWDKHPNWNYDEAEVKAVAATLVAALGR